MTKIAIRTRALSHAERMTVWVASRPCSQSVLVLASRPSPQATAAETYALRVSSSPYRSLRRAVDFDDYLASTGRG